jgi:DNA-binding beta-propeller fold protein YncE
MMPLLPAPRPRSRLALLPLLALTACESSPPPETTPATPPASACPHVPGTICTVAGTGIAGDGEDGLPPLQTWLYAPADVALDPDGRMVIVDWNNHRVRAVDAEGKLRIVAGVGELAPETESDEVGVRLNHPTDVTFDPQGRMVIAAWHNSRVKRLDMKTLVLEDIAGTGARSYSGDGGPALGCELNLPVSVLFDPAGNLLISDQANQRIRRIDASGTITTVAGSGRRGFAGDGGPALEAEFAMPVGQRGHPAGHIALANDGALYLADTENNRIRRIGPDGMVSTVAGRGTYGSAGDGGPALEAELAYPVDVALSPEGVLHIADTENNCVRKVEGGRISTVVGVCGKCGSSLDDPCRCPPTEAACIGDGGSPGAARLKRPTGIVFDRAGNLYVADTLNHRIRVVYR